MNNSQFPFISVVMTTYNHEKYVQEAIYSVISQTFTDYELIIVNDGSTDKTDLIIKEILQKESNSNIIYISQDNQGVSTAANRGILSSKGHYIALMSGDDLCYPHRLETQIKFVQETGAKVVFSWVDFIDDHSNLIQGEHFASGFFNHPHRNQEEILRYFFFSGNYLNAVTGLIKKELLLDVGLFLTTSIQLQDFDMWIKLAKISDIHMLPERLIKYRIRSDNDNLSRPTLDNECRSKLESQQIYKNFFDGISLDLFKNIFYDNIFIKNFTSDINFQLEKSFIYLQQVQPHIQVIGLENLFNILQNPSIYQVAESEYGFSMSNFYRLTKQLDFWNIKKISHLTSLISQNSNLGERIKSYHKVLISIILPVYNPPARYLREAIESVINQTYPYWELCIADDASTKPYVRDILIEYSQKDNRIKIVFRQENGHISRASNTALELATGEYIALLDHDDLLAPNALVEIVNLLHNHPEADMIYSDGALFNDQGIFYPIISKSAWCPDSFLSSMYTCHLGVYRTSLIKQIGGFRVGFEGSQDYDLVLRFTEKTDKIFHIPKLLYYWRKHPESTNSSYQAKSYAYEAGKKALEEALHRRGENGVVIPDKDIKGFYSIRYEINNYNLVSIIIPTRDLGDVLDGCLESIFSKTIYPNYEVILVDNGSKERETFAVIDKWKQLEPDKFKCHQYDVPFNYSHINNYAVTKAQGKYLLFLNNDTEVITSNWIDAMVEQAQRQSIGAVGAYLKYPDDTPQHTGVILGYGILAGNSHTSYNKILNFSAVTGACLMCRREVFAEIGGFDEQLEIAFNDVDLCLKMYQKGYQDVCLPHVLLYHYESKSIGYQRETTEKINRYQQEIKYMQNKWGNLIENDPCNSPVVINNYQENIKLSYQFTIVVPWWDHTNLLQLWEDNITFLQQAEVIFVDNGSAEEGKKALEEFCHKYSVKLIRNATNLGFSAANNQGLKAANREFILHLNNDISIKYLPFVYLAYLAENGIAGPGEVQNELYTPYVEGWGLCIKKSILEELGGWNEIYGPGYWDDVDLCYRAKLAGYPVIAIPQMSQWIEHITNATGRDGRLEQIALHITNRKKFIEQYLNISPKIIIDGVFFQLYKTGIARVWKSLLEEWANTDFANHILVLDRANTAPKINGIRYRAASPYNYNDTESDRQMLQQICDEEGAELFISTYYTTPINTPSVFMAYDMIPEVLGGNLNEPMWREKHNAIKHASAFISISENTASDLSRFFPDISLESITVAHCGVHPLFSPASENEINAFKYKYGINKPYFLLSGLGGYKNSILFLQAFSQLINKDSFDIVATGAGSQLPPEWRQYTAGCTFHGLQLSDEELRLAYAGAVALVYPSQYEGFGMPVAEAMACGCPVITTPNASLPEVGGEAVIYVKDDDIEGMTNALCEVQKPSLRRNLIEVGLKQAQNFSWSKMADIVSNVLINQALDIFKLREINLIMFPDWTQSEDDLYLQLGEVILELANSSDVDKTTLLIYAGDTDPETADLVLSSIAMNLMMEYEIDITERMQISLIEEINQKQWQKLLPNLHSRIVLEVENKEAISKFQAETLPNFEIGV